MICCIGFTFKITLIVGLVWFAYSLGNHAVDRAIVIDSSVYVGKDI